MGRELRRKQAKRDGKNVKEAQKKHKNKPVNPKTLITILVFLLLFFVILYILTGLFITKEITWFNNDNDNEEIQEIENKILAAETLKQTEEEYYVYYYNTTNENSEIANMMYRISETIYRVDLNDDFNSNFVGEPSGVVEDINTLKVSDPTLVKVSSEKIVEFYSGAEEIKAALN